MSDSPIFPRVVIDGNGNGYDTYNCDSTTYVGDGAAIRLEGAEEKGGRYVGTVEFPIHRLIKVEQN